MQADIDGFQVAPGIAFLYSKYAPGLLSYARMHVASQEDAEDLVVEVFLAAIENERLLALSEKAQQLWLWRVTRNKVIDAYRRAKTHPRVRLDAMAEHLFEDEVFSPENAALRQEDYMDLYERLQRLPAPQQEILRMRFGLGLSCAEIAIRLGKQENAVRVMLSRSLNLLRDIYRQRGGSN